MASSSVLQPEQLSQYLPADYQGPPVRSNEGPHLSTRDVQWLKETSAGTTIEEMRRRYDEDGYVYIKGLIPRDHVYDMREHYFSHMNARHQMLKPSSSPRDGIFDSTLDPLEYQGIGGQPGDDKLNSLIDAHMTPEYLKFVEHPDLRKFVRHFTGWEKEILLRRTMLRHNVPFGASTGIHYDKLFLRGGEAEFLTAWVPIGDCASNGGGLLYLEDSTELGKAIENDFSERAATLTPAEKTSAFNRNMMANGMIAQDASSFARGEGKGKGKRWLTADYEAGDVVFHNPWVLHCAGRNEDESGRIRLSTDLRFYEEHADLDERWMRLWTPGDGL